LLTCWAEEEDEEEKEEEMAARAGEWEGWPLAKEGGGRLGKAVKSIMFSSSVDDSGRGKMVKSATHANTTR
jgi:hypothetical protein